MNLSNDSDIYNSIVARQPIVNRDRKLYAYELLYRDSTNNAFPEHSRKSQVTKRLLAEQLLTFQKRNLNNKIGFINFTQNDIVDLVPLDFSHTDIVIEILETCEPSDELYNAVSKLKSKGYRFALDDFIPSTEWKRFYPLVDYIKLDIRETTLQQCQQIIRNFSKTHIQFIGEKIETYEEFKKAAAIGFHFFQGFFYQKPEIIKTHKLSSSSIDMFRLCDLTSKPSPLDKTKINELIVRNPTLSVQLLNFVNNDSRLVNPIKNIQQALAYLGDDRIRKYANYISLSALAPGKPNIVYRNMLTRARFMDNLTRLIGDKNLIEMAYLCGMLSLVDGLLDMELQVIINNMAIDESIFQALLEHKGTLSFILDMAKAVECSDWQLLDHTENHLSIDNKDIMSCLAEALQWVDELPA
ncbi:EAL and HDOD domain-containing protein [Vibrio salinus]|uniref:EAL and HDOD domain-containing protein n=1 Tax=Vibrio salinus TaxID=2899784 RepID=UPI001E3464E7|nr:EAL domain-containing protein [Vibrio salinus]MCE0495273.1 EAL domain-containing protein [Vibrio salinus]